MMEEAVKEKVLCIHTSALFPSSTNSAGGYLFKKDGLHVTRLGAGHYAKITLDSLQSTYSELEMNAVICVRCHNSDHLEVDCDLSTRRNARGSQRRPDPHVTQHSRHQSQWSSYGHSSHNQWQPPPMNRPPPNLPYYSPPANRPPPLNRPPPNMFLYGPPVNRPPPPMGPPNPGWTDQRQLQHTFQLPHPSQLLHHQNQSPYTYQHNFAAYPRY